MRFIKTNNGNFTQHKDKVTICLLALCVFLSTLSLFSKEREYVFTEGKKAEAPELENFCLAFINQIINKSLHREMVESDIYDLLIQDNYKVLNLIGEEKTLFSRSVDQDCSVIVQDKLGLRRFDIRVNKSFEYPFFYKVQKIDEPKIED